MKKVNLFLLLLAFLITASGCNTIRGATKGALEGLGKDAGITWQKIKKADHWLKKHAW